MENAMMGKGGRGKGAGRGRVAAEEVKIDPE